MDFVHGYHRTIFFGCILIIVHRRTANVCIIIYGKQDGQNETEHVDYREGALRA